MEYTIKLFIFYCVGYIWGRNEEKVLKKIYDLIAKVKGKNPEEEVDSDETSV